MMPDGDISIENWELSLVPFRVPCYIENEEGEVRNGQSRAGAGERTKRNTPHMKFALQKDDIISIQHQADTLDLGIRFGALDEPLEAERAQLPEKRRNIYAPQGRERMVDPGAVDSNGESRPDDVETSEDHNKKPFGGWGRTFCRFRLSTDVQRAQEALRAKEIAITLTSIESRRDALQEMVEVVGNHGEWLGEWLESA
ncbi:hypothetical protein BDN72DRAFT_858082 [Pluteus cervinus]|uniref:Uncharacterized protein n=1 Tax=Pluteus cervinus TaxID=181527 RepID=A0ACD3AT09_9AGAR|nr:hypothetical protein BDN72DRAFT_858082 [Pluteus cervinus]